MSGYIPSVQFHMRKWKDVALLAAELFARQVYWRLPPLNRWYDHRGHGKQVRLFVEHTALRDCLYQIGVRSGALVMVHSSVGGLTLTGSEFPNAKLENSVSVALCLLQDLKELLGTTGTLVMPTHPMYQDDPGYLYHDKTNFVLKYDPRKTPSNVGLLTELFRRMPDVQRSLHPLNTLSAWGLRASELLQDNLNCWKPLPHGVESGYYRLCQWGGMVISIGVPLFKYMTLMHTGEDVRDRDWPVKNFYRERIFLIRFGEQERECIVRERRPEFARCFCLSKFHRDLLREGILHEGSVGDVRVDWANANDVFTFVMRRNQGSAYPYYLPALAKPFAGG
jgi:aminoglycoside N3'-acetyltransferase